MLKLSLATALSATLILCLAQACVGFLPLGSSFGGLKRGGQDASTPALRAHRSTLGPVMKGFGSAAKKGKGPKIRSASAARSRNTSPLPQKATGKLDFLSLVDEAVSGGRRGEKIENTPKVSKKAKALDEIKNLSEETLDEGYTRAVEEARQTTRARGRADLGLDTRKDAPKPVENKEKEQETEVVAKEGKQGINVEAPSVGAGGASSNIPPWASDGEAFASWVRSEPLRIAKVSTQKKEVFDNPPWAAGGEALAAWIRGEWDGQEVPKDKKAAEVLGAKAEMEAMEDSKGTQGREPSASSASKGTRVKASELNLETLTEWGALQQKEEEAAFHAAQAKAKEADAAFSKQVMEKARAEAELIRKAQEDAELMQASADEDFMKEAKKEAELMKKAAAMAIQAEQEADEAMKSAMEEKRVAAEQKAEQERAAKEEQEEQEAAGIMAQIRKLAAEQEAAEKQNAEEVQVANGNGAQDDGTAAAAKQAEEKVPKFAADGSRAGDTSLTSEKELAVAAAAAKEQAQSSLSPFELAQAKAWAERAEMARDLLAFLGDK
eukprot:CAMPEP_0169432452 /NCGR_PEP_ID=MMETSP1042-20121227/3499_1 /TAXON_ID=464988 /ORGANISM="Hemiselmis andersenii, Strain CCMP1180" /LENGTH=551 /DNA_ID=CAMNT_0009542953 /DNA_START=18 /DNA_END=1673 /DNA_ORIENTATION=+